MLEGIVINQFQARTNQSKRIVDILLEESHPVLKAKLGAFVVMKESHEVSQPLAYFAPSDKLTTYSTR